MNFLLLTFTVYILNYTLGSQEEEEEVLVFLRKYGYLELSEELTNISTIYTEHADLVRESVSRFQEFYNLPVTGEVDIETLKLFKIPRCGNKDLDQSYTLGDPRQKWGMNTIKWHIFRTNYGPYVEATKRAFNVWAKHANLTFVQSIQNPNIVISFAKCNHTFARDSERWCSGAFDGRGGTLAHAYLPHILRQQIEIHIDSDEIWNSSDILSENTTSFFLVMVHEIGHALGLFHSDDRTSIMWPYYRAVDIETFDLSEDDITAIQKLYGKREPTQSPITPAVITTTTSTTTKPKIPDDSIGPLPDICDVEDSFSGFIIYNRIIYIFYKHWVWLIDVKSKRLIQQTPVVITDWIQPLREVLTVNSTYTVCLNSDGNIIFIINGVIYNIDSNSFNIVHRWNFSNSALGLNKLSKVNGAVTGYYGGAYIFFDDLYVIQVDEQFYRRKKLISLGDHFPGIPAKIDGVYKTPDGLLNFFSGDKIVRYNEYLKEVVEYSDKSLSIIGLSCPRRSLVDQLKELLSRILNSRVTVSADS